MKKKFKLIFCCIITTVVFTASALVMKAAFENTHINTSNSCEDFIAVIETQLGYMEGSLEGTVQGNNDRTKYGEWYGMNDSPWCAIFISWCADQAGVKTSVIPKHANCDIGMQWFINREQFTYSSYYGGKDTPKRGDIVFFGHKTSSGAFDSTHEGVVYKVQANKLYVYEGNSSDKVHSVVYTLGSDYILGFATPQYENNTAGSEYVLGKYIVDTAWLNFRSKPDTSSSAYELLPKNTLLEITEINENNWGKAEYNGNTGWVALSYCRFVYEVSFDANGGTNAPASQFKFPDVPLTITTQKPIKDGFEFAGWSSSKDNSIQFAAGDVYNKNSDITLYAVWNTTNSTNYTVSFDANGGTNAPDPQIKEKGKELIITGKIPVREGYTFLGWSLDSLGSAEYKAGDAFTLESSVTLYAVWEKSEVFTVTYNANGGNSAPETQTKTKEKDLILSEKIPVYNGHTFMGWAITSEGEVVYQPGDKYTKDESVTLYAVWKSNISPDGFELKTGEGGKADYEIIQEKVKITITANKGYAISYISVNQKPMPLMGDIVEYTLELEKDGLKKVEIKFSYNDKLWINPFNDVADDQWYYDAVKYCYSQKIMMGVSKDSYAPNKELTRGEFVTIIGRLYEKDAGVISCNGDIPFTDITDDAYYYTYLCWAYKNEVVLGTSETTFSPSDKLTREQLCVMLYKYHLYKESGSVFKDHSVLSDYTDFSLVSDWAKDAVSWAVKNSIVNGSANKLMPKDTATRSQAANIIMKYCG